MAAAFSRLQLAAALLEYDNDPDNPKAPRRSAQDSAIFSHLRRANGYLHGATVEEATRSRDLLGVALPSEAGGSIEVKSTTIKSRASVDLLQNPFGEDEEDEQEVEALEVDLASWGLDTFMPKEKAPKGSKGVKGKSKSDILPSKTRDSVHGTIQNARNPLLSHGRAMSDFGFGGGGAFLDAIPETSRRNSISNPYDAAREESFEHPPHRNRVSSYGLIEGLPVKAPLLQTPLFGGERDTIPFPTASPGPESELGLGSRSASRMDSHMRTQSNATMGSPALDEEEHNPFAIPPPPEERASRFDPKYAASHARTNSNATRLSVGPRQAYDETGSLRAPSRMSAVGPKPNRDRRISAASFGTRDMLDDDFRSEYGYDEYRDTPAAEKRYSKLDLMRPKILIMPSPLQNVAVRPAPSKPTREGFLDSSDSRPLPPGARSSRMSMLGLPSSANIPVPSNSFTPNPRLSLSASQLLFRNALMVDGQRDVSYNDVEGNLRRAEKEGEQVNIEYPEEIPVEMEQEQPSPLREDAPIPGRPAGKLFGKSLIDDLEDRKRQMKNKQRVFYGDQRPSMMDRGDLKRSSTLIDPASLNLRPQAARTDSGKTQSSLNRNGSRSGKPLLTFGDDGQLAETVAMEEAAARQQQIDQMQDRGRRDARIPKAQSVFGVDKLWEREMVRLKDIEAQEKIEEEERKKREAEEEARKPKKKKGRSKRKDEKRQEEAVVESPIPISPVRVQEPRSPVAQPMLPDIPKVSSRRRTVPVPDDDESDNESSASEAAPRPSIERDEAVEKWVSDDEEGTGARPLGAGQRHATQQVGGVYVDAGDDSDEDVPLSMTLQRASKAFLSPRPSRNGDDSEDEDRPLSTLLLKPKLDIPSIDFDKSPSTRSPQLSKDEEEEEEEDNVPLGVRASRMPAMASSLFLGPQSNGGVATEDDDRPLSMHPGQVRKSQFQMFAQMQQQQMFEAQMRSSMMFNPMMMMPPAAAFVPRGAPQDNATINRVDRWRHNIVADGES